MKYLIFTFELGYGDGLPVVIPLPDDRLADIESILQTEFSDDEYISFDENYIMLRALVDSAQIIETEKPLPIDEKHAHWIDTILEYAKEPVKFESFTNVDESESKISVNVTQPDATRLINEWTAEIEKFQRAVENGELSEDDAILRLGQGRRIFSDLEDMKISLAFFGVCHECGSIMTEEGCLTYSDYVHYYDYSYDYML